MTRRTATEVRDLVVRRMATIDALTKGQRQAVHDLGWRIVKTMIDCGVTDPAFMRRIVNDVLAELRPPEVTALKPGKQMASALMRKSQEAT